MPVTTTLQLSPKQSADAELYTALAAHQVGVRRSDVAMARVIKRSIDARRSPVKVNLTLELFVDNEPQPAPLHFDYPDVSHSTEVVVVGSGPAGLFTSLRLIELGLKPILLERGKQVLPRKQDIALISTSTPILTTLSVQVARAHSPMVSSSRAARNEATTTKPCRRLYFTVLRLRFSTRLTLTSVPTNFRASSATSATLSLAAVVRFTFAAELQASRFVASGYAGYGWAIISSRAQLWCWPQATRPKISTIRSIVTEFVWRRRHWLWVCVSSTRNI